MRPEPLQELFPEMTREQWREEGFAFGEVTKESVYMLTSSKTKLPVPIPAVPNFKNHGNEVVSVSALARYQQRQAEEAGAYVLTETSATQLIVEDGRVVGVRSGDKGRGKDGEPLGNFEPGTDIKAQATVLAEGCWGHLTGAAIKEFDLAEDREPQVWELGVKEVWKVPKPLDRVIHTFVQPWPLKVAAKYGQLGGTWMYPMKDEKTGEDLVSIGFVVDLDYRDATTSAHDLLQTFKTHPLVQGHPRGRRARRVGREGAPGRRLLVDAEAVDAGRGARRRRRRDGRHGGAEGRAPLHQVGHARGRVDLRGAQARQQRLLRLRGRGRGSTIGNGALRGAQHAPGRSRRASSSAACSRVRRSCPRARCPRVASSGTATTPSRCSSATPRTATPSPTASTPSTSSPRCSSPATPPATTRPTTSACRSTVPREIAETWRWMCPAGVYEIPEDAPEKGEVDVIVNYTNCVQCGAITAKGGRLTTPEGGDGPLYQVT